MAHSKTALHGKLGLWFGVLAACFAAIISVQAVGHEKAVPAGDHHDPDCAMCLQSGRPDDPDADDLDTGADETSGTNAATAAILAFSSSLAVRLDVVASSYGDDSDLIAFSRQNAPGLARAPPAIS